MNADELQKVIQWLNGICGQRIQAPDFKWTAIEISNPSVPGDMGMSATEIGDKIDQLLDKGHFVSYKHAFHEVTIVGRTEDCRYIIQDSIPESAWNHDGGLKVSLSAPEDQSQITFENQHFQYWPRAILLKNVVSIDYIDPN